MPDIAKTTACRGDIRLHFSIGNEIDVELFDKEWYWIGQIKPQPWTSLPNRVIFDSSDGSLSMIETTLQQLVDKLLSAAWAGRL